MDVSVEYLVAWQYADGMGGWIDRIETFYGRRSQAEEKYDEIVRLEATYGTPRHARLSKRTITTSDWQQVDR